MRPPWRRACAKSRSRNAQAPYYLLTDGTPVLPTNLLTAVNAGDYARVPILGSTRNELRSFFQSSVGWTEAQ